MQSLRQRKTSQSSYTSREKSFSLKEHDEEFGKQEEIFGVCLPSASVWASSLDRRGRVGFETVWLLRSNHFSPPISLAILSFPLCCTHRPNSAQHDSSLHCYEYQSAGLKMRCCYCRRTVCANREGRCTWLQRSDRIMMSSGNISASFLNPQILFSCSARDRNQHGPLLWHHSDPIILGSKLTLAPSFRGCCWLTSKCPSYPQASLPSDAVLGAVIPTGLAFQNKGCMFSVCLSKEGCVTAGLTDKQTESGEPRPNLATSSQNSPRISFLFKFSLHTRELIGKQGHYKLHALHMLCEG